MDMGTKIAYQRGWIPDRYWNQLNEKSAQENYNDIIMARKNLLRPEEDIIIRSEVKLK